jgi:hypothetical protein
MNSRTNFGTSIVTAILALVFSVSPAMAHRLGADCTIRGKDVQVEAFFSDNTSAKGARISVLDSNNNSVAEGRTDDQGAWSFPAPEPGVYRVIVEAGNGHRAEITIDVPQTIQQAKSSPSTSEGACDCCNYAVSGDTAQPVRISEGPSRDELTKIPWLRMFFGLILIAGIACVYLSIRKSLQARKSTSSRPDAIA